jgi:gamma-glutamyltranspeptidase / glutathione hydrolase
MARTPDREARPASMSSCRPVNDFRWARKPMTAVVAPITVIAAWLSWFIAPAARAATPPPLRAAHAAVASDNPLASAAGLSLLQAGGNAIDAACATALALGVVHPFASGIGGGGFAVVYVAKEKKVYALDFRERAPAAIRPDSFLRDGRADPALSATGGLAVAVPGEVRGLGELVRRWGALPFRKCVEPAQRLATRGFPVSWRLAESFGQLAEKKTAPPGAAANGVQAVKADPVFETIFGGKLLTTADRWKRPDLAWTLDRLRAGGADAFYKGEIASAIVKAVRDGGGVMSTEDLTSYAPSDRAPLEGAYRGLRVFSMPPSSSGGIVLIETLGILSARYPDGAALTKLGRNSSAYLHVLAEAFKHGFADRARQLGDTDFVTVDLAHLTSAAYHRELAARIKDDGVQPRDSYGMPGGPAALHRDGGTTNLCVIDAEGNAVALTTTVNLGFGAKVVAGKTGILLNDQMDDFSLEPGVPNAFGLVGSTQNAVAPGKRPLSSMTPTIVLDGDRVKMTAGAAGGPTIITATTQVLLNVLDFGLDAQAAVSAPRVHDQWMPEVLSIEPDIVVDVRQGLEKRGQKLRELPRIGVANAIVRTERGLEAAAEPRSAGAPAGY